MEQLICIIDDHENGKKEFYDIIKGNILQKRKGYKYYLDRKTTKLKMGDDFIFKLPRLHDSLDEKAFSRNLFFGSAYVMIYYLISNIVTPLLLILALPLFSMIIYYSRTLDKTKTYSNTLECLIEYLTWPEAFSKIQNLSIQINYKSVYESKTLKDKVYAISQFIEKSGTSEFGAEWISRDDIEKYNNKLIAKQILAEKKYLQTILEEDESDLEEHSYSIQKEPVIYNEQQTVEIKNGNVNTILLVEKECKIYQATCTDYDHNIKVVNCERRNHTFKITELLENSSQQHDVKEAEKAGYVYC